jgi:SAM-dependent methyltransferase
MDEKNSYKCATPYATYCKYTTEKRLLHKFMDTYFAKEPRTILDIGCGNGINTFFMANRFPNALVDAIERSEAQVTEAKSTHRKENIIYTNVDLEHYDTINRYDFILASHVLQYIDSDLGQFVKKAAVLLDRKGELWFVQQTKEGMAQIIAHQMPYLTNPRFKNWKTFDEYYADIGLLLGRDYDLRATYLDGSFSQIDFANPSIEDKWRLEFIFCLDEPFEAQSQEFKNHLSRLKLGNSERIAHKNGIVRITRKDGIRQ